MPGPSPRPLDVETAVTAVVVRDVQLSPDRRWVVFASGCVATERDTPPTSALWLVDADGQAPTRRLSTSEVADSYPRWSPDGTRLAFLSDRRQRGSSQIYLLDLARGGEAVRLTGREGGVRGLAWSPDGQWIAFTAPDEPDPAQAADAQAADVPAPDEQVVDERAGLTGIWLLAVPDDAATLAGGELPAPRRVSAPGVHTGGDHAFGADFGWAPDSGALVTVTARSPRLHDGLNPDLVTIDLDGAVHQVARIESLGVAPRISPDGSTIAYNAAEGAVPALFSLQTVGVAGGPPRVLLPGFDGSFFAFSWLPDGRRLLAIAQQGQQQRLVVVDPEAGTASEATKPFDRPGSVNAFSVSADGRRVAFVRGHASSFGDVFVADLDGEPRQLTDLNPWLRDYAFGEVREISWTSFDGLEIQGLLTLPVGYTEGERYPMLLHIHGGPMAAWLHNLREFVGLNWAVFLAQRGYAVLQPNPRGSSGRGTEFLRGIAGCYGEPDWQDLMSGVDKVVELGIADPDRLVVGGWSGGGFLTNWTVTHTDRFKAAVSGAGIANWVSFQGTADCRSVFDRYYGVVDEDPETHWRHSPIRYVKAATTPTLILYGENDRRTPPTQGHEMYQGLKARGVQTELVLYPREGHGPVERLHQIDLVRRVVDWFGRHLTVTTSKEPMR